MLGICSLTASLSCPAMLALDQRPRGSQNKGKQRTHECVPVCSCFPSLLPQGSRAWCCGTCDSKHLHCTGHKDTKDKVRWIKRKASVAAAQGVATLARSDRANKTTGNFLKVTASPVCLCAPLICATQSPSCRLLTTSTQRLSQTPCSVGYAHSHPPVGPT